MKEKILTALKKRFEGFGVSDLLLDRFATKLAVSATDETMNELVNGVQFSQLVQSEVDAKLTEANKKAVENAKATILAEFRKAHNLDENGKPITTGGGGEVPGELMKLFGEQKAAIELLSQELKGFKTKQTVEQLKSEVYAKLESAKVPKSYYSQLNISIEDPEKVSETVANIVSGFNTVKQEMVNQNLVFDAPPTSTIVVEDKEMTSYLDGKFGTTKN